jgi:hypothetical protein
LFAITVQVKDFTLGGRRKRLVDRFYDLPHLFVLAKLSRLESLQHGNRDLQIDGKIRVCPKRTP